MRTTFILTLWTFIFFLWLHWFLLKNWAFEIFYASHWQFFFNQWWNEGMRIDSTYYWTFVLTLFLAVPFWILMSCVFLSVKYSKLFSSKKKKAADLQRPAKIQVKKQKSYKEVRPKPFSAVGDTMLQSLAGNEHSSTLEAGSYENIGGTGSAHFSHRELSDNDLTPDAGNFPVEGSFADIPLPADDFTPVKENIPEIINQSGAFVLEGVKIGKDKVDFTVLSEQAAYLVLLDNQLGDWLADEERFNNEDPLWFSESAHRVSPVAVLKRIQNAFSDILKEQQINLDIKPILVKTNGNIINAEDMLDIWKEMNVTVVRSDKGRPEELPVFGDIFPKGLSALDQESIEKITNVL